MTYAFALGIRDVDDCRAMLVWFDQYTALSARQKVSGPVKEARSGWPITENASCRRLGT
jgi:hypothetical protein